MNSRIGSVIAVLLLGMALVGCAAVEPVKTAPDTRLDQVLAGMNQCLDSQARTAEQLQQQAQQLQAQERQMASVNEQLDDARKARAAESRPVVANCPKPQRASNKAVVGYMEKVWLPDLGFELTAKIDTGISTSSLDAKNIELFERDGKRWVRFEIIDPDTNEPKSLERKLKRSVGTSASDADDDARLPVVQLGILVGSSDQTAEFVLYDRSHKTYQLKIGRNILQDVMMVDVSKKNIASYTLPEKKSNGQGDSQ